MPFKTFIVEDEEKSLYVLQKMISDFATDLTICGNASHISSAVKAIEVNEPDLLFMDIRIADGTGFDVLKQLSFRNFELIFITAFDNYALDAFRFAAIDYLLKPIGIQEFEDTLTRARERLTTRAPRTFIDELLRKLPGTGYDKKISIPTPHGYDFVDMKDIIWCGSEGSYTMFYLSNGSRIISSQRLGLYEEQLYSANFFRIHHSIIVNLQFIKSYIKGKGGYVIMTDGTELEVSQRKKGEFLDRLMM